MRAIILTFTFLFIASFIPSAPAQAVDKRYLAAAAGVQPIYQEAPGLAVTGPDGKAVALSGYRGKVVLLHFWATWCTPCKDEFPVLDRLYKELGRRGVEIIAIGVDSTATDEELRKAARSMGGSFPVYLARSGTVPDKYWRLGVPETYFIDKKGMLIGRALGPRDWGSAEVTGLINALIEEN